MTEFITKEQVQAYPYLHEEYIDRKNANPHFLNGVTSLAEYVESLPAADVAPLTRAKWEYSRLHEGWLCTNCWNAPWLDADADNGYKTPFEYGHKYCPYCGALIDECIGKRVFMPKE